MRSALAVVCLVVSVARVPAMLASPTPDLKVGPTGRDVAASALGAGPTFRSGDAFGVGPTFRSGELPQAGPNIRFTDVTAAAGVRFTHTSGAFGKKYLPETLGSGVAFLDYDNDGWQDLFFVNSTNWPGHPGPAAIPALYHNNRNGTFTDVTRQAGLAVQMYGLGVAAADFDNDGDIDIYVTCLGANHLFSNEGGGRFSDVTARAGVGDPGFSTGAA